MWAWFHPTTNRSKNYPTRAAAIEWIAANQLGRRDLTSSQKAALALELEKQLSAEAKKQQATSGGEVTSKSV
jgi:hypothetical protein